MGNHWLKEKVEEWSFVDVFDKMIYEYWCDDFDLHWSFLGLPETHIFPTAVKRVFFDAGIEAEQAVEEYKWMYDEITTTINALLDKYWFAPDTQSVNKSIYNLVREVISIE